MAHAPERGSTPVLTAIAKDHPVRQGRIINLRKNAIYPHLPGTPLHYETWPAPLDLKKLR